MTGSMRNQIENLYNAESAPLAARRDAFAERLQNVRESAFLLYNRMMDNIEHGRERLKDIVEKETREKEEKEQAEDSIDLTATTMNRH